MDKAECVFVLVEVSDVLPDAWVDVVESEMLKRGWNFCARRPVKEEIPGVYLKTLLGLQILGGSVRSSEEFETDLREAYEVALARPGYGELHPSQKEGV